MQNIEIYDVLWYYQNNQIDNLVKLIIKINKAQEKKMRISTAEIKILIKECVKSYGMYTTADFKDYINKKLIYKKIMR